MMGSFLKVWWMAFWRLLILFMVFDITGASAFIMSVAFAAVMVYGMKKSILIAPIFHMINHKTSPFIDLNPKGYNKDIVLDRGTPAPNEIESSDTVNDDSGSLENGYTNDNDNTSVIIDENNENDENNHNTAIRVQRSSNKGKMTGFEPFVLDKMDVPSSPFMVGTPGESLSDSSRISDKNKATGTKGEENFAKALRKSNNLLDDVSSIWSVPMPSKENITKKDASLKTDIDAIIVTGRDIFLLDMKLYRSGDVTYKTIDGKLSAIDNATGAIVGDDYSMSQNMKIASERFSEVFKHNGMKVTPIVVLMPNNDGQPIVDYGARWTGDIPVLNLTQTISRIRSSASSGDAPKVVIDTLTALKR